MNGRQPTRLRRGYTLVELLIVVALLATMVGLAVPSLRRMTEKGRLQDAARQLRAQLLGARLEAIESAACRYFFYEPGGGGYRITRSADVPSGSELQAAVPVAGAAEEMLDAAESLPAGAAADSPQTLAFGIRFLDPLAGQAPAADTSLDGARAGPWAEPVIFFPNGRSLNARIRLASDRYWIDLRVRGLTGTVQLEPVERFVVSDEAGGAALPETSL